MANQYTPPANPYAKIASPDLKYPSYTTAIPSIAMFATEFVSTERAVTAKELSEKIRIFLERTPDGRWIPNNVQSFNTYNIEVQMDEPNVHYINYAGTTTNFYLTYPGWITKSASLAVISGLSEPGKGQSGDIGLHSGGFTNVVIKNCLGPKGKYVFVSFDLAHAVI